MEAPCCTICCVEVVKKMLHSRRADCRKLAADINYVRIVTEIVDHVLDSGCFFGVV